MIINSTHVQIDIKVELNVIQSNCVIFLAFEPKDAECFFFLRRCFQSLISNWSYSKCWFECLFCEKLSAIVIWCSMSWNSIIDINLNCAQRKNDWIIKWDTRSEIEKSMRRKKWQGKFMPKNKPTPAAPDGKVEKHPSIFFLFFFLLRTFFHTL